MNQIKSVHIDLMDNQHWQVSVMKTFAPENGGGSQVFQNTAPSIHAALDIAKGMVTMSPANRESIPRWKAN